MTCCGKERPKDTSGRRQAKARLSGQPPLAAARRGLAPMCAAVAWPVMTESRQDRFSYRRTCAPNTATTVKSSSMSKKE